MIRSSGFKVASVLLACSGIAMAADLSMSGFATFTAGKVLSGTEHVWQPGTNLPIQCPCNLAGWEYAQLYHADGWQFKPESVVGLQMDAKIDEQLAATVQIAARGAEDYKAAVDWAYLSYKLDNRFTLQAGRKHLPIYYLSDSTYVGYTYPWVRPPGEVYGWEIANYDGVNVMFRDASGDWSYFGNAWLGREESANNPVQSKVIYGVPIQENWRNIMGASLSATNDIVEIRGVYMQNQVDASAIQSDGSVEYLSQGTMTYKGLRQRLYGVYTGIEYNNWIGKLEYNIVQRGESYSAPAGMLAVGYRFGSVTAMLSGARYWEKQAADDPLPTRFSTTSALLRWDFSKSAALKVQYDRTRDSSMNPPSGRTYLGDSNLLTVSISTVF
ncbi:hypothetical protein KSF73_14970 [Burkholderiaceae bacterium DAT-1]|nr:hypothetical protein [Burkholderiaceae bacterium DAT-1]